MLRIGDNHRVDTIQHLFAQLVTIRTPSVINDLIRPAPPRRVRRPPLIYHAIFVNRLAVDHDVSMALDHAAPRRLKSGHLGERFVSRSHGVTCAFDLLLVAQICIRHGRQRRHTGGKGDESCQNVHHRCKARLIEHREMELQDELVRAEIEPSTEGDGVSPVSGMQQVNIRSLDRWDIPLVELRRIELLTSSLRTTRSPS